mmetsp:Transcript_70172/g.121500  ORF Transcript_70172/g.121500 Transcript_70172/m.121500 type:complete len:648 (+) Transcript_70172:129-2072(+)
MAYSAKIQDMLQSLKSYNPGVRLSALNELAKTGEHVAMAHDVANQVASMASDQEPQVQAAALLALGSMGEAGNIHACLLEAYLLYGHDLQDVPSTQTPVIHPVWNAVAGKFSDGSVVESGAEANPPQHDDNTHVFMEAPFLRRPPLLSYAPESLLVRRAAARAIGRLGPIAVKQAWALEKCLDSPHPELVADCCVSLGALQYFSSRVVSKLHDEHEEVVAGACTALGRWSQCARAIGLVGLNHASSKVRMAALNALSQVLGGQGSCEDTSQGALSAAKEFAAEASLLLEDGDWCIRHAAARFLLHIGMEAATVLSIDQKLNIVKLLENPNPGVRASAALALGGIGGNGGNGGPGVDRSLVCALENLLEDPAEDMSMKPLIAVGLNKTRQAVELRKPACAAVAALSKLGGSTKLATAALQSKDFEVRVLCVGALVQMFLQDGAYLDTLVKACKDPQPRVVAAACEALAAVAEGTETELLPPDAFSDAVEALLGCLDDTDPRVRAGALRGLAKLPDEAAQYATIICKLLNDRSWPVRLEAARTLAACGPSGEMYATHISALLEDASAEVRVAALEALATMGRRGAAFADEVAALVKDPLPTVRVASLHYLGGLGARQRSIAVTTAISEATSDPMQEVRKAANEAARMLL